jgi:cytosine/uracil/thiamine/allantoin permease
MKLPILPQDKANHFVYGCVIAALGCIVSPILGALLATGFGVGKEVYDIWRHKTNPGSATPDIWDATATIAGGLVVVVPAL